jgi:hypothetical protein
MDAQLEFLQIWASACQVMADAYVEHLIKDGEEKAWEWWCESNADRMNKMQATPVVNDYDDFARNLVAVGSFYVDLMIRFGVFDGKSTD